MALNIPDNAIIVTTGEQLKAFVDVAFEKREKERIMSIPDVAQFLGISKQKVYRLRNKLKGYQLVEGGDWQFDRTDVYEYKAKMKGR